MNFPVCLRLLLIALGVAGTASLRAAAETPALPPPPALVPIITFDEMFFNFGKVRHGQTVSHGFKVTNTGRATLHIKEVKAICGCTSTVLGKTDLAPGESTEIEAEFTPENDFSGAVRKAIMVVSDAPAHPVLTLRFGADVIPSAETGKAAP